MTNLQLIGGALLGIAIGIISGIVGIGGGALLVPALLLLFGMSQREAQGTSIATLILPIGIFALIPYWKAGHVNVRLGILIALGFAIGGWFGGQWAQHLSDTYLRRGFAVLLVVLAAKLFFMR